MSSRKSFVKVLCVFSAAAVFALLGFTSPSAVAQEGNAGAVYVLSNQHEGNAVIVFHRSGDGMLTTAGRFATGGNGAGEGPNPLHSQGPLILSNDNRMLFAVNAGSNSITAFSVRGDSLERLQTIPSNGDRPVSLTVSHDMLYVLNAGESPNISGFRIVPGETPLVAIEGSTRSLPEGDSARPAEVSFSPDGRALLVSETGTNQIVTFAVSDGGHAALANTVPSPQTTPYGMDWAQGVAVVVAYAANGTPGQGGAGSFQLTGQASLAPVTPDVQDNQTDTSWAIVTRNGNIAIVSNSMSGTLSTFAVSDGGHLQLAIPAAAKLVGGESGASLYPAGLALSNNSQYLYVRTGVNGAVNGFRVHEDGSLTAVTSVPGLPDTAAGIAAR